MATATSSLEDLATCPICFEVYINPQSLGCLHVFCASCVHKLTVNNRLECPECRQITKRTNIKSDFNKQSLVDLFLKHQEDSEVKVAKNGEQGKQVMKGCSIAGMKCQGCKKIKPVKYECRECQKLMCADCESAHQYFPVTMKHNVSSLETITTNVKSEMKKILKNLRKTDEVLKKKIDFEKELIQGLQTIEVRTVKEVNQHRENLKINIDQHHDDEIAKFKDSISKISQAGVSRKTMYDSHIKAVETSISLIDDVLKTSDLSTLLNHRENNSIQTEMQKMQKSIDGIVVDTIPNVKVTPPQWNFSNCTKITMDGSMDSGEPVHATFKLNKEGCVPKTSTAKLTINPTQKKGKIPWGPKQQKQLQHNKKDYMDLLDNNINFRQRKEVVLQYVPKRMLQVGDQIWCCGVNDNNDDNGLYIYDTDCNLMQYTPLGNIESITAITYDHLHNNIIVSYSDTDGGLYQVSHNHGTQQRRILHKGGFNDVVMYNGDLYALHCNSNSVIVFKYTDEACMWTVFNSYTLKSNIAEFFSLGICENDIYVCSYDRNTLLKLNQIGEIKQKYGVYKEAGRMYTRLWNPTLCSVDESGNMLVATKQHLYLGSKHDKWSAVNLDGEYLGWVKDALVDSGGNNVWICCTNFHGDWRLRKYLKS